MKKNGYIYDVNSPLKKNGFSLIEIMITGFILALGLLGLAGMQSTAVKSSVEIKQRTLANSLAMDITERMHLNRAWLSQAGNNYAIASLANATLSAPACVNARGEFANCTGVEIKNNDLFEWQQKFNGADIVNINNRYGLIGADACIGVTAIAGSNDELVEVVISWFSTVKSRDAAAGAASTSIRATCGQLSAGRINNRRQLSIQTYISKSS